MSRRQELTGIALMVIGIAAALAGGGAWLRGVATIGGWPTWLAAAAGLAAVAAGVSLASVRRRHQ